MVDPSQQQLTEAAERLAAAVDATFELHEPSEGDLRHRLFLVLGDYALGTLEMRSADVRQEGTGLSGRYDSLFGRAVLEYKQPGLLDSTPERREAAQQAIRYLEAEDIGAQVVILTDGRTWGILRDPEAGPEPQEQAWLDLGLEDAALPAEQRFAWRSNGIEACRRVLTLIASVRAAPVSSASLIDRLGPARSEVQTLFAVLGHRLREREDDGRIDLLFTQWIRVAGVAYGIDGVDAEWPRSRARLMGDLAQTLPELTYPETVFVLHTYVGVACKLVACELLALRADQHELRPTQWLTLSRTTFGRNISELEAGALAERLGAPGLLAGDLFGWYVPLLGDDDALRSALVGLLEAMAGLAWGRVANTGGVALDLMRDFYQSVVPSGLRKALGEFFTPRWLAERVLRKALELRAAEREGSAETLVPGLRILDPTCGSGTFLVAALRVGLSQLAYQERADDPESLGELIDNLIGFDINPVSVLMARVNLLLALGERSQRIVNFRPRVYEADSIVIPGTEVGQRTLYGVGDDLIISTAVGDFFLPRALASLATLETLRSHVEYGLERGRDAETFRTRLEVDLSRAGLEGQAFEDSVEGAVRIFHRMQDLEAEAKDGVWSRIIEQAMAPALLDPVDLVVGNPPWVSWKDLPAAWKNMSERLWKRWGLWQRTARSRGGIPLSDIAVLLAARALDTYAPDGHVALLFPLSVQIADPGGRQFRRCELEPDDDYAALLQDVSPTIYTPIHLDDFSELHPFAPDAQNEPIAIYMRSGERAEFPFPASKWSRVRRRIHIDSAAPWSEVSELLYEDAFDLAPIRREDPGGPWAPIADRGAMPLLPQDVEVSYEWGRGYETRGLDGYFIVEILSEEPSGVDRLIRIRNLPNMGSNSRGERPREAWVEPDYIWPLIKGEQVRRWNADRRNLYCIVPHHRDDLQRVISVEEMIRLAPNLYDYLEPWIPAFLRRSLYRSHADENRPWGLSGPFQHLREQANAVLVRYIASGGRPAACVVDPRGNRRLGRDTTPFPNNKSNVYFTLSEREAHYLAAWVNSTPTQDALGRFAAATGITPRALQYLPIPRFQASHAQHARLADLSVEAHRRAAAGITVSSQVEDEIDEIITALAPAAFEQLTGEEPAVPLSVRRAAEEGEPYNRRELRA